MGLSAGFFFTYEASVTLGLAEVDDVTYVKTFQAINAVGLAAHRRDPLIIRATIGVAGANVYPAEVEAALNAHAGVQSSAVIGLPDEERGNQVHAIVQPADGLSVDLDELRIFLGERLVGYKIPRSFEFIDEPLRDDAGKVRRSLLREARL